MGAEPCSPRSGYIQAICAYSLWGIFPLFWSAFSHMLAGELIAWRVIWSSVFFGVALLVFKGPTSGSLGASQKPSPFALTWLSAFLIGANWLLFIWGVLQGRIIETSLGYFINPLFNMLIGYFFFRERMNGRQWGAVVFAGMGVVLLTVDSGAFPWLAILLASTFSFYGVCRKITKTPPLLASFRESLILTLPACAYLGFLLVNVPGTWNHWISTPAFYWLSLGGALTAIPLLLFAMAAQRIPLSALGFIQFISPTLQFLVGWFVMGETVEKPKLLAFGFIWVGIGLFMSQLFGVRHPGSGSNKKRPIQGI